MMVPIDIEKLEPGYELPYLIKFVTLDRMRMFSECTGKSLHTDVEFAKSMGLPTAIAQGLMSEIYLIELLTRSFGQDWLEGGRISVNFVKVVFAGDTLFVRAKVRDRKRENSGTQLELEVWCEDQQGELKTVGTASVLVRSSA